MKEKQPSQKNAFYSRKGIYHPIRILAIVMTLGIIQLNAIGASLQQQLRITGTVTDVGTGQTMPGVNIVVKGSTIGVISDESGKYSIEKTQPDAILVFSFIGYVTQEVPVAGKSVIDVALLNELTGLQEVVVVGYGTQKRVSLTSAVAPISAEALTKRTVNNVQQSLQGNIAGLTIQDLGSSPGRARMVMRIRGVTTLSGNDPLVIVDGIEQDFSDINPLDIETITVLKDASSTAIYGSRASNGVLLVTTKRAKDEKLSVSLNSYYAIQRGNNKWEHMGLADYLKLQQIAWTNSYGNPGIFTDSYIDTYVNATDRELYPLPNEWFDYVVKPAPAFSNTLSISGGTDKLKSLLNIRHLDQKGVIPNNWSKISEVRLNSDYKVNSKISFSADLNYRDKYIHAPQSENRVVRQILQNSQFAVPIYSDGTYGITADGHSPLIWANKDGFRDYYSKYLFGNLKGSWEILNGLQFTVQYGIRSTFEKEKSYRNSYDFIDKLTGYRMRNTINSNTETRNDTYEYTLNGLLNYSKSFGMHSVNLLAGYSDIKNNYSGLTAFRQAFYNNDIQSLNAGINDATKNNSGLDSEWALRSFFGRVNYSLKDRYLFEGNIRRDGSSRFTGDNTYSMFPSFSAGWRLSEESFFQNLKSIFNEVKLRGSYGNAGNQAVGLYSFIATYSTFNYSFADVTANGYRQAALANTNIGWETTTQTDIGTDIQMYNGRISVSVDYYVKNTFDILLNLPVPATLGLDPSPQNAGRVDNTGWDFSLTLKNSFGELDADANFNLNINKNEVKDLAGTGPYIYGGNETRYTTRVGLPILSYWGYETDGYFQTPEEVAAYPNIVPGVKPGDVKFVDRNGDGRISPDDMMDLGRSFPKYNFGGNFNLAYKGFALNLMLQGVGGYKARLGGALAEMGIWGGFTHKIVTNNYWTPENPNARFPRPLKFDLRNIIMADRDLTDGSYLRLKNIQLQYSLPNVWLDKIKVRNIALYISSTNLLTFAKLNEFDTDPETQVGTRAEIYPQTSTTTLGINVNF